MKRFIRTSWNMLAGVGIALLGIHQALCSMHRRLCFGLLLAGGWLLLSAPSFTGATNTLTQLCPAGGIQVRSGGFQPGGIILASFDRASIWVYNIDGDRRYPLPETHPCGSNCRLSRDARWVTYYDPFEGMYSKMRLDGTERTPLTGNAADVEWWPNGLLLVWTSGHEAYLQTEDGSKREALDVRGVISVQPGGQWGLTLEQRGDSFSRVLVNLATRNREDMAEERIPLGPEVSYFNAASWSPDGQWLAYVAPGPFDSQANIAGGEIFAIRPSNGLPAQWTDLTGIYGAVRINGHSSGELSWSPDSAHLAFWVIELLGTDPENNTGNAVLHMLDVATGDIQVYCGFSTVEHTPNPPRIIWSPDSTHVAFGGNIPGDDRGYLLLALDTATGTLTALSEGIYPALGTPDPIAWGLPPG